MSANTPTIVKRANTALVVNTIRAAGPLTIDAAATATSLSRPTVVSIVRALEADRILRKVGHAPAEVGRQPALYGIDDTARFAIGIDIDGPPARIVLTDLSGVAHHISEWTFELTSSFDTILSVLEHEVNTALLSRSIEARDVVGIGLGLPASVDIGENSAVNLSRLTALRDGSVGNSLAEAVGIPVSVRNDAHLIALAEDPGTEEDYLYIAFRTGVGLAIVIDSVVFEGLTGNAGFIGHTSLDPQGPLCACGARGCLEAIVSKRAIVEQANIDGLAFSYADLMDLASADPSSHAADIFRGAARWLGLAIANLVKTTDIYTVIIGDLGGDDSHPFFREIAHSVQIHTSTFLRRTPDLRASRLSGGELALGGAQFVIDRFFETPRLRLKGGAA